MNRKKRYLALAFGAGSGVAMAGGFDGAAFELDPDRHFAIPSTSLLDTVYWDFPNMMINAKLGLSRFAAKYGGDLAGVACSSWGADFGLLDKDGRLLANPVHFMDARTEGAMERLHSSIPARSLYQKTGTRPRRRSTLYQLFSMAQANSPLLDKAVTMLLMADLASYFLSGTPVQEYTLATTSGMCDAESRDWSRDIILTAKIPPVMVPDIVAPGTVIGPLADRVAAECGAGAVPVIAAASHGPACAAAAAPAKGDDWLYILSGLWNSVGVETAEPVINDDTYSAGFTNEGGVDGSNRLAKSVGGMWVLAECVRAWHGGAKDDNALGPLLEAALGAKPLVRILNLDDPRFLDTEDMPAAINRLLRESGQPPAESREDFARLCLDSVALAQRHACRQLTEITGRKHSVAHLLGWGAGHAALAQTAADALGIPVKAGPVEAKAIGNIIMQAMALGDVASLAEAREIVDRSFDNRLYEPADTAGWDAAYGRFVNMP